MIQVVASENCIHCHESNCCTNLSLNGDGSSILGLQLENMDEYVPPEDTYKSLTCSAQETPSNPPCKPQLNQRNPTNRLRSLSSRRDCLPTHPCPFAHVAATKTTQMVASGTSSTLDAKSSQSTTKRLPVNLCSPNTLLLTRPPTTP